jgi:hypothetical protein
VSEYPFDFYLNMRLISLAPVPTRRLHVRAEAAQSAVRQAGGDSQRIIIPASADVSGYDSPRRHLDKIFTSSPASVLTRGV